MALIPVERLPSGGWVPGTNVGVPGGVNQYRPGGASQRVTLVTVTDAPYLAAGVATQTTGTISSGSPTLVVASATSFQEGQTIVVGVREVQTLTVTGGASVTDSVIIYIGADSGNYRTFRVPVVSGDTATQVATKIRAYDYTGVVAATGSGTDVIFTYSILGARIDSVIDGTATGVTGSFAETTAGLTAAHTTITTIAGTTFTLNANASANVTGGQVLHDDSPAIQAAVTAAIGGAGNVVYLPAGYYWIWSTISLGTTFSGKTLRGAGSDLTHLIQLCNEGIVAGSASATNPAIPPVVVTSGISKGSTSVVVDQIPSGYEGVYDAGSLILFQVENDPDIPVVSVYNYDIHTSQAPTNQMVRVTSQSGTTINFFPALYDDYGAGTLEARFNYVTFFATGIGVEDFTIDANLQITGGGAYEGVGLHNCYGSWIRGVNSWTLNNYPLIVASSLQCEVRRSWGKCLTDAHSSKSSLLLNAHACLIEDNIFEDPTYVVQVNGGAGGNVFIYNFTPANNGIWDSNHDPHNRFNLYEANAISYLMSDGYFGGESELTAFRCYFAGPTVGTVHMRRFSRYFSVVGSIHTADELGDDGYPEIGNIGYAGTAQPSLGDYWADYQMTATLNVRTSDTDGELSPISGHFAAPTGFASQVFRMIWGANLDNQRFGVVTAVSGGVATFTNYNGGTALPAQDTVMSIGPGNNSMSEWYHELDLDVAATTIDKGNYYIGTDTYTSLGGDPLPDSLVDASQADSEARGVVWGNLEWPPFDATDLVTADVQRVPAGYRYVNGQDPPTGSAVSTGISGLAKISGTVTIQHA